MLARTSGLIGGCAYAVHIAGFGYDRLATLSLCPPAEGLDGESRVAGAVDSVRSDKGRLHSENLVHDMKPSSNSVTRLLHRPVLKINDRLQTVEFRISDFQEGLRVSPSADLRDSLRGDCQKSVVGHMITKAQEVGN